MTAATVLLWRHGQTDYNSGGRLQGQVDIALNETGQAQAAAAAEVLMRVQPVQIVSSDLSRAHDTARILGQLTGVEVRIDQRLRERSFGQWEGLTHAEIAESWPEQFVEWGAVGIQRVSAPRPEDRPAAASPKRWPRRPLRWKAVCWWSRPTVQRSVPASPPCSASMPRHGAESRGSATVTGRCCARTTGPSRPGGWPRTTSASRVLISLVGPASANLYPAREGNPTRGYGAVGSALPWHGRGRGFESP